MRHDTSVGSYGLIKDSRKRGDLGCKFHPVPLCYWSEGLLICAADLLKEAFLCLWEWYIAGRPGDMGCSLDDHPIDISIAAEA